MTSKGYQHTLFILTLVGVNIMREINFRISVNYVYSNIESPLKIQLNNKIANHTILSKYINYYRPALMSININKQLEPNERSSF